MLKRNEIKVILWSDAFFTFYFIAKQGRLLEEKVNTDSIEFDFTAVTESLYSFVY